VAKIAENVGGQVIKQATLRGIDINTPFPSPKYIVPIKLNLKVCLIF
jgi:hypothetical protein